MKYRNAVALVPGFFGFGRLGNFYYFADRVAATLRGAAERRFGSPTPVMGLDTRPTACLADRQELLLRRLQMADEVLEGPDRFHLVGHSTGGLDAELLRAERPLRADRWSDIDARGVRGRLASIVTIAAPHYGTCLSRSHAVGFLRDPVHHWGSLPDATRMAWELVKLVAERPLAHEAALATLQSSSGAARFVLDLITHNELLGDLLPENMERVRRERPPVLSVGVVCFVTAAPDKPAAEKGRERKPDHFFDLLQALTGRCGRALGPEGNVAALNDGAVSLIRSADVERPSMGPATNDGVVNATSQLLAGAALGALVVADHADVLGHYDRVDPLTDGAPLNEGFFRSGAAFGDDSFFDLYGRVANAFAD
jgi:hypothetical protein